MMNMKPDKIRFQRSGINDFSNLHRESSGKLPEVQAFFLNRNHLHRLVERTQDVIKGVNLIPLQSEIVETIKILKVNSTRPPAIVVLGAARARLVNFLLGENLLPVSNQIKNWRWLRIVHGKTRQLSLSLGEEFEVVETSLMSINNSWNQIPLKDLRRNNSSDLQTVMDVKITNPFLENGLEILVPPDLGDLSFDVPDCEFVHPYTLKDYESFYTKRSCLLESVYPIVLYALDDIGPIPSNKVEKNSLQNVKEKENHVEGNSKFYLDRKDSEKDLHYASNSTESSGITFETNVGTESAEDALHFHLTEALSCTDLTEENMLDLRQIYELHPNVKIFAVLFSDSTERTSQSKLKLPISLRINNRGRSSSTSNLNDSSSNQYYDNSIYKSCEDGYSSIRTEHFSDIKAYSILCSGSSESPMSNRSAEQCFFTPVMNTPNDGNKLTGKFESNQELPDSKAISDDLLKRQLNFRRKLMNEFNALSTIYSGKKADSYFLIVDDSELETNIKKSKTMKSVYEISFRNELLQEFFTHAKDCLKSYILDDCDKLNEIHRTLLQQFILSSFDMAREMQIIPKKIDYVVKMEQQLRCTLLEKFNENGDKREELLLIMNTVLEDIKAEINSMDWANADASSHNSNECINLVQSQFYTSTSCSSENDENVISNRFLKDFDIVSLKDEPKSNSCEMARSSEFATTTSKMSFKQASLEVQKAVLSRISHNISLQLVRVVDCLRDSYFGTLQRCLESLEKDRDRKTASEAVKRILLVTKSIDLQNCASFSLLNALVDSIKRLFFILRISSRDSQSCCVQSIRWKRQVALDTVESLSAAKLAKLISKQLCEKIETFHEQFQSALHSLGNYLETHLQQTEDMKYKLRKQHAPKFASLYLESTSLGDMVRYGMPKRGKEMGRGQYGIVFSVKGSWGGHSPCAVKSVVPPDERHFNDLAMEFFQARNIPDHDRIVKLYGCVIDYSYRGSSPDVLLISQKLKSDLHCGLMQGNLSFHQRMQIAIDIVEGIRYLHSRGLVHRDIKMKNVLLDEDKRAKLTDLGFCLPEAMMSGSIVGTPIHMAPELIKGVYDSSVDVYAFGILFWYLCSGSVRMPSLFEQFKTHDQLWTHVIEKGIRPERLPKFSNACWDLMEKCWASNPADRPLLGIVQPVLEAIRDNPKPENNYPAFH